MATLEGVKNKIQRLLDSANAATGNTFTDLTTAVNVLIAGYATGGSSEYYRNVTFMEADNETVASRVAIAPKYRCDEESRPKPTKESTTDTDFTLAGWSLTPDGEACDVLDNIVEDVTLYPVFVPSVRYYTIRFFDDEGELLRTEKWPYGGSSDYVHKKIGAYFTGWTPEPTNITSDMDCYGTWEYASFAKDSWEQIRENASKGVAAEYYSVGDEREITLIYNDGRERDRLILQVAHIHGSGERELIYSDESGSYSGYAGIAIVVKTAPKGSYMAFSTEQFDDSQMVNYTKDGIIGSDIMEYLDEKIFPYLPADMQAVIPYTQKTFSYCPHGTSVMLTRASRFKLWPLSTAEVQCTDVRFAGLTDGDILYELFRGDSDSKRIRTLFDTDEAVPYHLRTSVDRFDVAAVEESGLVARRSVALEKAYVVFGFCLG